MQALCAECNGKKGARLVKALRKHQSELERRARDIAAGVVDDKITTVSVTPGGGKSLAASIFARILLDAGIVARVAWVCPRSSLALQSSDTFNDKDHNPEYCARRADNTPPLIRDAIEFNRVCYTTTYQSIAACPEVHVDEVRRDSTLVILDEPHHLADEDGRTWAKSVGRVVDVAEHVLLMTGTIERHDRIKIPFIQYKEADGKTVPVTHVSYSLRDAIVERSILPIEFTYLDGWVNYIYDGEEKSTDISKATYDEVSRVIQTFLSQASYRDAIVRRGLDHWISFRENVYASRAIVVCSSVAQAREVAAFVDQEYGVESSLAVSEDPDSQRTIEDFRKGRRGKVLVTVGMAYEGLDVPDCTHLVCLTATRSVPWLMQAFARVTRVDWKAIKSGVAYERQHAFVFVPDDPLMRKVVEAIRTEQMQGLAERREITPEDGNDERGGQLLGSDFTPVSAIPGQVGSGSIDERMSDEEAQFYRAMQEQVPGLAGMALSVLRAAAQFLKSKTPTSDAQNGNGPSDAGPPDAHEEMRLRRHIELRARARDNQFGFEYGTTNKTIHKMFRKSREAMGIAELRRVLDYVKRLEGNPS